MSDDHYKTILVFGMPGSGKGTQGKILGCIPGFFHLACGDVFRSLDVNSPEGKEASKFSSRGELVPDDLTIRIWKKSVRAHAAQSEYQPREELLVLDGIPRNVQQAQSMQEHICVLKLVHLVCSDEDAMVQRMQRRAIQENRADDAQVEVIRKRFEVYRQETALVLDYYADDLIAEVDALGSPAEVLQNVLKVVVPVQNDHFLFGTDQKHDSPK